MDQLRGILKIVWRERFWVLSVVGILVAVVCWQMSTGALDGEFTQRKGAIDGKFKEMQDLKSETTHPNDVVNEENQKQAVEQSKNVLAVWQELYDRQRKEVLYWPKDSLQPWFIEAVEKLKFRDPLPVQQADNLRAHYWNYIQNRFDGLLKIVKALKSTERGGESRIVGGGREEGAGFQNGRGAAGAADGAGVAQDYLVQWLDQGKLQEKLQFKTKPTAVEIWVTQEDLWVYETLLNVIAATNKERGATRPDNAAVRVIENLEVGRDAAAASRGKSPIIMPRSQSAEGGEAEAVPVAEADTSVPREGGEAEGEGSEEAVLAYRYLDPEGNPYASGPEDKEYRRLPVRMVLEMDQRSLPQLLVECANATLPVEVKQVRINPEASASGEGERSGGRSPRRPRSSQGEGNLAEDPNLVEVEIRGVVCIYNQPDETIFEGLGGDEGQLAEASAGN